MVSYNIKYPLNDDPTTNTFFLTSKVTKDAFSSNLFLLLLTEKGERYYDPNYGTNLLKYIFEPNDNVTTMDIEQDIKQTVSTYIPNLNINSVEFFSDIDEYGVKMLDSQINVRVKFTFSEDAFSESGVIDIKF